MFATTRISAKPAPPGAAPPVNANGAVPDIFVSYARADQAQVLELVQALETTGWSVWIDTTAIPPASEWRDELVDGIRRAHTFLFVITPESVRSEYCRWELDRATELEKRLVPVVLHNAEGVPDALAKRQYILARPGDDHDRALETLNTTLATDLDWVRAHREWLMAASRWDQQDRDRSLLVRGRELKEFESWLVSCGARTEPAPTQLQTQFLFASRAWRTRRLQITAAAVALAFVIAVALGVLALLQRNSARNEASIARSRELAATAASQLSVDPERSLLLATEAVAMKRTSEAGDALRRAVAEARLRLYVPPRGTTVGKLVTAVAFSPDGTLVSEGLADGSVWVARSAPVPGQEILRLPAPKGAPLTMCPVTANFPIKAIAFSPDRQFVAAVNDAGWTTVWSLRRPNKTVSSPVCSLPNAYGLAFAQDGSVVTVAGDGVVYRWPWRTHKPETTSTLGVRAVSSTSIAGNGATLAVLADGAVWTWGPRGAVARRVSAADAYALAASADARTVVTAEGRAVNVLSPAPQKTRRLRPQAATVRSVAVSQDGKFAAAGDQSGAIRVWDLSMQDPPVVLRGTNGPVTALSFSSDGRRVVSGGDDGALRVWAWGAPSPIGRLLPAGTVSLSDDGSFAYAGDARSGVLARVGGGRVGVLEGLLDPTQRLSVDDAGDRAAASSVTTAAGRGTVRIWELRRGSRPRTVGDTERITDVALSPDGRWIASAEIGSLRLWRWPGTPKQRVRLALPPRFLTYTAPAVSPDGEELLAATYNGKQSTILAWNLPAAADAAVHSLPYRHLASATGMITHLAFSPDGKRVAVTTSEGTVLVLNRRDDAQPLTLRAHAGSVYDAAFSPDGAALVSAGVDGAVRVWNLTQSRKSVRLVNTHHPVSAVAFTRDGSQVIVIAGNHAQVWRCDACGSIDTVLHRARRMAARSLTPAERASYLDEG